MLVSSGSVRKAISTRARGPHSRHDTVHLQLSRAPILVHAQSARVSAVVRTSWTSLFRIWSLVSSILHHDALRHLGPILHSQRFSDSFSLDCRLEAEIGPR